MAVGIACLWGVFKAGVRVGKAVPADSVTAANPSAAAGTPLERVGKLALVRKTLIDFAVYPNARTLCPV